jgi:hypothetical protein
LFLVAVIVINVVSLRGVDWDAVELPSQFMENWCYDKPTLYSFAKHYQTSEPLPTDMFERLKAAKTYRSATQMLRQVGDEAGAVGPARQRVCLSAAFTWSLHACLPVNQQVCSFLTSTQTRHEPCMLHAVHSKLC